MTSPYDSLNLQLVLELLAKHTFMDTARILGLRGDHADKSLRRLLERKGIDPRQYAKTRRRRVKGKEFWVGKSCEYTATPEIIRVYLWQGHTVKVYEPRYARM